MLTPVGDAHETFSEHQHLRRRTQETSPHLELLVECERPLAGPARYRLTTVRTVRLGRGPQRRALAAAEDVLEVAVPDGWMSSRHAELRRTGDVWELTDLGSKNGTLMNGVRLRGSEAVSVADDDVLQLGHTLFRFRDDLPVTGPAILDARDLLESGSLSPAFAIVVERAAAVAPTRVPVLLRGETGTGKEVLAQTIHGLSGRAGPFVAVNSGAIPAELVESELFGHRKGAFSGALADGIGLVRTSDGGTLFLDEIGDLPLEAQPALLRVIQEREVTPVGVARPVAVDLRVIAATHRDLEALVAEGKFRPDLLARIDGVALDLPPLRDRREDVPLLLARLLAKLAPGRTDVRLAPDAAQALLDHDWPRNVRELEQALAGALALSTTGAIEKAHLPRTVREPEAPKAPERELTAEEQQHRRDLVALLSEHRGNLAAVARAVGKGRTQVVRWIARYALDPDSFRDG